MSERSDLAQNFFDIDKTIDWYLKSNAIVEQECGYSNGHLKHHSKLNEYETRRRKVRSDYESKCLELVRRLNDATAKLPDINNFFERYLQNPPRFIRRHLVLGEVSVHYQSRRKTPPFRAGDIRRSF